MENYRYLSILKRELDHRIAKNPQYSLRAFANFLNLDSGTLSAILKGKRSFPLTKIDSAIHSLELTPLDKREFKDSIIAYRNDASKRRLSSRKTERETVLVSEADYFHIISEWEYPAIITMMELEEFQLSSKWISSRLGISEERASGVLNNLEKTDLIDITESGRYKLRDIDLTTTDDIDSEALQMGHKINLDLAKEKLQLVPVSERDYYAYTFAIHPSMLPEIKKLVRDLRVKIDSRAAKKKATDIFQINVQVFPLTK